MAGSVRRYWTLMATYLRPQWRAATVLAVLVLASTGTALISPQVVRFFIDSALSGAPPQTLTTAAALFVGAALVGQVVEVAATCLAVHVGQTATDRLRLDLLLHCLRLDMGFHNRRLPGELIERVDGDVNALSGLFSRLFWYLVGNVLVAVGVLVLLFREDWRLGAAFTIAAVATLAVLRPLRHVAPPRWRAEREASAALSGFWEERISGAEDVRANGAVPYVMRRLYQVAREQYRKARTAALAGRVMQQVTNGLLAATHVLAFVLSAYLLQAGAMTIGTVYLVYQYSWSLFNPLIGVMFQVQDLQRASAGMARIQELLGTRLAVEDGPNTDLPPGALSVEMQHVSFAYGGSFRDPPQPAGPPGDGDAGASAPPPPLALHDVSFRLAPGQTLGLLGRTGSGKTTISRLLLRLYDPTAGVVRLGGVDVTTLRQDVVRRRVGTVTQDVQLFQASVRDNLTFFDPSVPDATILAVLQELGLGPWYELLPDGMDTELASGGSGLSAGQAQLLAFARVFIKDPGLVILDEASSRLDPATERLIERAIDRLIARSTAIIIAHRLHTLRRADDILILEDGRVREYGPRIRLAAEPTSHLSALMRLSAQEVLA